MTTTQNHTARCSPDALTVRDLPDRVMILDRIPERDEFLSGGTRTYARQIAMLLRKRDVAVDYVCNQVVGMEPFLASLEELGCTTATFTEESKTKAAKQIDAIIGSRRPTIIHINTGSDAMKGICRALRARHDRGVRMLFTMHGPLPSATLGEPKHWLYDVPGRWRWRRKRDDRRWLQCMNQVISVCETHAIALTKALELGVSDVSHVPNGVDTDYYVPAGRVASNKPLTIGTAGQLVRVKRIERCIRAFADLKRGRSVRLRIAGAGPKESDLKALATELQAFDSIEFCGQVDDMREFYQSLDIFMLCSESEGLPFVQLEAMSCGLPSIVTDVGDLPRVVRHGIDGFVVHGEDQESISHSLAALCENESLRVAMGACSRQRAVESYSRERFEREMLQIYHSLCASRDMT